eukprot:56261-Eustigmatos_ZCMA.PRE.1
MTDSENARVWITTRRARNRYAMHLLRLLTRIELLRGFEMWAERVTSEENTLPDCASRYWTSEGEVDQGQVARWNGLLKAYRGPHLREEQAGHGSEHEWLIPT